MPAGKLAAQAGHAFSNSLIAHLVANPDRLSEFHALGASGSRVTLRCKNEEQLCRAHAAARAAGLPCALIVDRDHILPPHFTGAPVVTALGIGPCVREACRDITKRFRCV